MSKTSLTVQVSITYIPAGECRVHWRRGEGDMHEEMGVQSAQNEVLRADVTRALFEDF